LSLLNSINWIWPALALAFSLGVIVSRAWQQRRERSHDSVNQEYFKGLNFLLNEQPDKAIEVFIKALEVDSETVELHLALGGLFRRKGQVDRATRIHQNLIARPSLTEEQRLQAIYELSQDYYKAGLLDRAENLYLELKESPAFRELALEGLCNIYQQEKDWKKAIGVCRLHKRNTRSKYAKQISHYWCELAERSMQADAYEEARKFLRSALAEDRTAARAVLLRGELHFRQANYQKAMQLWQSLSVTRPVLAGLVIEKMMRCYQQIGDDAGLKQYLFATDAIPKSDKAFDVWRHSSTQAFGKTDTFNRIVTAFQAEGPSGPAAEYLFSIVNQGQLDQEIQKQLIKDFLNRAKKRKIEYTCAGCGFDVKAMYWLCPNCGEWDSFS